MKETAHQWLAVWGKKIGIDLPYFVQSGFWVSVRQIASILINFAFLILFTRLSTKEVFGQFQLVLGTVYALSFFSLPGLNVALQRSVAKGYDGDYQRSVRLSLLWSIAGSVVLLGVGGYFGLVGNTAMSKAFIVSAALFPLLYAPNTWDYFLQGKFRFDITTRWGIIQLAVSTLATVFALFLRPNDAFVAVGVFVAANSVANVIFYRKSLRFLENQKSDTETIPYGIYLTKTGTLGTIVDYIDRVIIGFFDVVLLASYTVVLSLSDALKNLIKSFFSVTFPKFAKYGYDLTRKLLIGLLIGSLLLSFLVYVFSGKIILLFFSEKYADAIPFLGYLSFLVPFFVINSLLGNKAYSDADKKVVYFINFIAPLLTLLSAVGTFVLTKNVLVFVLTKVYSKQFFITVFYWWFSRKKLSE